MIARVLSLPLIVILMGIGAFAMFLPAAQAYVEGDLFVSRVFFYGALLFLFITAMIAMATLNYRPASAARSHLLALLATFTLLPTMLAVPMMESVPGMPFWSAYFEMVSSLTTTGASLFDDPARLPNAVHYWRGLVGWMGGFFIWVTAIAILAPMNLGGFEVTSRSAPGQRSAATAQIDKVADPTERLTRFAGQLFPIYTGLTVLLWVALILSGESAFVALIHAMSTLSTSGISPVGGLSGSETGIGGEALIFLFLLFAISRMTFARDPGKRGLADFLHDPEVRIGFFLVVTIPLLLFLRHWTAALEAREQDAMAALHALWGGAFTVLSFLTTTGFESGDWAEARLWSGLNTPGLILLGLAMIGGGVATTAGGVKLLRVYALYKHGRREIDRLIHPSMVAGSGASARQIRRQGAYAAWIFFMLFDLSIALVMVSLSATGLSFETAMVLTISALSTTGPLASAAVDFPFSYATLDGVAQAILLAAMVLGRLETLAIVALLNPEFWRA